MIEPTPQLSAEGTREVLEEMEGAPADSAARRETFRRADQLAERFGRERAPEAEVRAR